MNFTRFYRTDNGRKKIHIFYFDKRETQMMFLMPINHDFWQTRQRVSPPTVRAVRNILRRKLRKRKKISFVRFHLNSYLIKPPQNVIS